MKEAYRRFDHVVLAAHGAGDDSSTNSRMRTLCRRLNSRSPDVTFEAAFNRGEPKFAQSAAASTAQSLVIPIMTSDGYFVQQQIAPIFATSGAAVSPPLGSLPELRLTWVQRVAELGKKTESAAVLIIGHGTPRHPGSAAGAGALANELRQRLSKPVYTAYLDQSPFVDDVLQGLRGVSLVMVPFLVGGGTHEHEDIARLLQTPHRQQAKVFPCLLDDPLLEVWILNLANIAVQRFPLRIGTRSSRLARWQASAVAKALADVGVPTTTVMIDTLGDLEANRPLDEFSSEGVFTDAIEAQLAAGRIDLAVHSLKDLPLKDDPLADIVAVLPRGSAAEVLVSRHGQTLAELRRGAVVGTSSPRRALQLKAFRPDLETRPVRGNVENRVAQVLEGRVDAAILARAGLERLGMSRHISDSWPESTFVPQAGQGVMAVQSRPDDWFAKSLCSRIDHHQTRRVVWAELAFARRAEQAGYIAAAYASMAGDDVVLRGRVIEPEYGRMRTVIKLGGDPAALGNEAAKSLGLMEVGREVLA